MIECRMVLKLGQPNAAPTYANTVFSNTLLSVIYVPDTAVDAYKSADGWSDYADLIKPLSEKPAE